MKNIVEYASSAVAEIVQINKHTDEDWDILAKSSAITMKWSADLSDIYAKGIQGCPMTKKVMDDGEVNVDDHQSSFLVWYENMVSGAPGTVFWAETCLIGLYHASAAVENRHVIAMGGRIQEEFLSRAIAELGADAMKVYGAFKRIFDAAVGIMVDSYLHALMLGMMEIGINERLVNRIRRVAIRRMIDQVREVLPLIDWTDALSVGIKSIDDQHKVLMGYLNDLHDVSSGGGGNDKMKEILQSLVEYTVNHFAYEEDLFEKFKYPDIVAHKKAHVALVDQVGSFNEQFQAGNAKLSGDLFKFLRTWLNGHIRGTDKKYTEFMIKRGVK